MPRKTRAAAAKAQDADVDDAPQEVPLPATPKREREPLLSITPNSVESPENERVRDEEMGKPKGKKGKKGGAKKNGKTTTEETADEQLEVVGEEQNGDANADIDDAVEEPAAVDEMASELSGEPKLEERPQSSLARSTRLTRRQQALADAEAEKPEDTSNDADEDEINESTPAEAEPAIDEAPEPKPMAGELILSSPQSSGLDDSVVAPTPTALEQSERSQALSPVLGDLPDRTGTEAQSLCASNTTSRPASQVENPIEAIDALEDETDEVAKVISSLNLPLSPVKPRVTKKADKPKAVVRAPPASASKATSIAKPSVPRPTKLAATTQPSATSRIRSLAEPKKSVVGLPRANSTKTRPKSVIMDSKPKDKPTVGKPADNKPVDHLAAKRRPVSVSFPTPPPPPKSKKPTTTASFTLPGEAVAAKLKAAKLERQAREEEEAAKKREFKARPVPSIRPNKPVEVKQTAASRARLSVAGAVEKESTTGLKRASTVTGASTTSAIKRNSIVAPRRTSVIGAPKALPPSNTANTAAKRSSIIAPKLRAAPGSTSTSVKERTTSSSSMPRSVSAPKSKEIYNRGQVDSATREKAQKEKDEAVKRARADAAERGRQASREWAQKQKKALEKKVASPVEQAATAGATAVV